MYCVIQEIEIKKVPTGEPKEIEAYETTWTTNSEKESIWGWNYSDEHFDRPVRKTYRISIHESYREAGKVKKKQTVICTIGYYSIVDWGELDRGLYHRLPVEGNSGINWPAGG